MNVRNLGSLFLLFLSFSSSVWSQPSVYAPTADENSLLWQITGPGLKAPSYLFGTIHMIPAEDFVLNPATRQALEQAKVVAFEIDTEDMTNPMAMFSMLGKMYMNNDTTLSDLLSAEEYTMVSAHFDKLGLPLSFLKRVKPMFLSVLAAEDMKDFQMGGGDNEKIMSYELELTRMAKEQEKDIQGLETIEYQMSLFDSIPYGAQARMLVEAVQAEQAPATGNAGDASFARMVEMYKNQDIIAMQGLMDEEGGIAGYEDLLLVNRNRNWIAPMSKLMKEQTTFFAVGAGHLAGNQGVIALLREQGFEVKAVRE